MKLAWRLKASSSRSPTSSISTETLPPISLLLPYNDGMTSIAERLLTEDEFLALPDDPEGRKLELYNGTVICMPQPGEEHARIARSLFLALLSFVSAHNLGDVFFDLGFKLRSNPDRTVSPDVSFVRAGSLAPDRDRTKSIPMAPWLAIEVVSPNDIDRDVTSKAIEYIEAGSQRAWIVRPAFRSVTVHRADWTSRTCNVGETLTSDDAGFSVDGFELPVADIFELD
jgi:Uma2 family endonuclease